MSRRGTSSSLPFQDQGFRGHHQGCPTQSPDYLSHSDNLAANSGASFPSVQQFSSDLTYEASPNAQSTIHLAPRVFQSGSIVHPAGRILPKKHQEDPQISLEASSSRKGLEWLQDGPQASSHAVGWDEGLDWFEFRPQKYYACIAPLCQFPATLNRSIGAPFKEIQNMIETESRKIAKLFFQHSQLKKFKAKAFQLLESIANFDYQILQLLTPASKVETVPIDIGLFDFLRKVISVGVIGTHDSIHQPEAVKGNEILQKLRDEIRLFLLLKEDTTAIFESFTTYKKRTPVAINQRQCLISKIAVGCLEQYYRKKNPEKFGQVFGNSKLFRQAIFKIRFTNYFGEFHRLREKFHQGLEGYSVVPWEDYLPPSVTDIEPDRIEMILTKISTEVQQARLQSFLQGVVEIDMTSKQT
ncbi:hypothetical protein O181_116221 [Austropuccinia psidii MF-1]|uniref:Uncharacterized protein n=1 Tax=Austropuccinia psidii MF-1 TaxID=1389203 RepID=A0A9Q3KAC2_9BASI|nr:hypothetical protein [Austropuccinia psidii MF-1]